MVGFFPKIYSERKIKILRSRSKEMIICKEAFKQKGTMESNFLLTENKIRWVNVMLYLWL